MSHLTLRIFSLLLTVIVVQGQSEIEIGERVTNLWSHFFNQLAAPGIETVLRRLPILASLTPPPPTETTTTVSHQVIFSQPVHLQHQPPLQEHGEDGRPEPNTSTFDDDHSINSVLEIAQNEYGNSTTIDNEKNLSTNDTDSNNTMVMLNDAEFDEGNETISSESPPIIADEPRYHEESKRISFQQGESTSTGGATFNLNANSNSNSDPNISNGFSPNNFLAGFGPLVLPLINSVGVGLSQHHLDVLEAQKRRLALLNAPRPYSPPEGADLPGFGTALFNELLQNRRPGGFGSALANDLARSEQSSNGIEAVKISPPLAFRKKAPNRSPARGLPVYPRPSAVSNTVLSRNVEPPTPRKRYSSVPRSIRKGTQIPRLIGSETRFTDASQWGGAQTTNSWNSVAQVTTRSPSAYNSNSRSTLNEFAGGNSRFPEVPSLSPEETDVEGDGRFLGTAFERRFGPTGEHGFGSAYPDYSNLPGSDLAKEVPAPPFSFAAPSSGERSDNDRGYHRASSNQQSVSENFPQLPSESFSTPQETSLRGPAVTSFPPNDNQKPPLFPDTFSLRTDGSGDFYAGSGLEAANTATRGPPAGVFGSGRQPDESIFDTK